MTMLTVKYLCQFLWLQFCQRGVKRLAKMGDILSIQFICLGQTPSGFGKLSYLSGITNHNRQSDLMCCADKVHFQTTRGFNQYPCWLVRP